MESYSHVTDNRRRRPLFAFIRGGLGELSYWCSVEPSYNVRFVGRVDSSKLFASFISYTRV